MDLVIAEMSGHSSNEREIRNSLRDALDRIRDNGVPTLHFP